MDPNEALTQLRTLASKVSHEVETLRRMADGDSNDAEIEAGQDVADMAMHLASQFWALDTWLSKGGFLPDEWHANRPPVRMVVEPLGGPVPGVNDHHLPDVDTWTGDPGTPEYKAETERRIDRYLGRNPDE
jgi:hypothetical protein